ncbi:hypothetical protein, unlikely [Trypanosoma congolense IL3000]|uniref:Uncharacterized protein n=1 Tax=Trypanosoma congolense (strain IL3000) TaxID=1068625 RepID=F9W9A1_TRYCI|nr:hypothetical protein, unlikely [Trypanosoma congolense IL3000]
MVCRMAGTHSLTCSVISAKHNERKYHRSSASSPLHGHVQGPLPPHTAECRKAIAFTHWVTHAPLKHTTTHFIPSLPLTHGLTLPSLHWPWRVLRSLQSLPLARLSNYNKREMASRPLVTTAHPLGPIAASPV